MKKAQKRDAVLNEKLYFRKDFMTCDSPHEAEACCTLEEKEGCNPEACAGAEYTLLSISEIISGKPGVFVGLVPLLKLYLQSVDDCDVDTSCTIMQYLSFIQKRASGELMTTARWMREFVAKHPSYKHDSVVNDEINYDLVKTCDGIMRGTESCPKLLPSYETRTKGDIPKAMTKEETHWEQKRRANGSEVVNGILPANEVK